MEQRAWGVRLRSHEGMGAEVGKNKQEMTITGRRGEPVARPNLLQKGRYQYNANEKK